MQVSAKEELVQSQDIDGRIILEICQRSGVDYKLYLFQYGEQVSFLHLLSTYGGTERTFGQTDEMLIMPALPG